MTGVCFTDGCDKPKATKNGRFCNLHMVRLRKGQVREVDVLPKCPGCRAAMREPAETCGLCIMEVQELRAKERAA